MSDKPADQRFTNFLNIAHRENLRGHDWVAVLCDAMRGEFDGEIA